MPNNVFTKRSDGNWYAPPKDPADSIDYPIDLSGLMEGDTDAIQTVDVTIEDKHNSLIHDRTFIGTAQNAKAFVLWFSGGKKGTKPLVNFVARTINGRVIDREFYIEILDL